MVASYECACCGLMPRSRARRQPARELTIGSSTTTTMSRSTCGGPPVRRKIGTRANTQRRFASCVTNRRDRCNGCAFRRHFEPGVRHAIEQVRRQDCQIGEYVGRSCRASSRFRRSAARPSNRPRGDGVQRLQLRKPRIAVTDLARAQRPTTSCAVVRGPSCQCTSVRNRKSAFDRVRPAPTRRDKAGHEQRVVAHQVVSST